MGQIYHASTDCIAQFLPNMSSDVVHFKFNSVPRRVQSIWSLSWGSPHPHLVPIPPQVLKSKAGCSSSRYKMTCICVQPSCFEPYLDYKDCQILSCYSTDGTRVAATLCCLRNDDEVCSCSSSEPHLTESLDVEMHRCRGTVVLG